MMKNERGYTLIEIMAALSIACMVAATAGMLIGSGIRYFERESRHFEGEDLVDRIGKQLVKYIAYATDLKISNRWEYQEGMTAIAFDTDGCVSAAFFSDSEDGGMPEAAEIFGPQYFGGRKLRCGVTAKRETVRILLTLMEGEEEICSKEISVKLINMELNGRRIRAPEGVTDNGAEPVVFYIGLDDWTE